MCEPKLRFQQLGATDRPLCLGEGAPFSETGENSILFTTPRSQYKELGDVSSQCDLTAGPSFCTELLFGRTWSVDATGHPAKSW
jgi:hypothetical protein